MFDFFYGLSFDEGRLAWRGTYTGGVKMIMATILILMGLSLAFLPLLKEVSFLKNKPRQQTLTLPTPLPSPLPSPSSTTTSPAPANEDSYGDTHRVKATVFWVGEPETDDNGFISNVSSAWDHEWRSSYGGEDDPYARCGFKPCAFEPRENPFYVALPYNDLDDQGRRKESAALIPWFSTARDARSVLKNRWVRVTFRDRTCFGQWEDVGPFESDDFASVFGQAEPKNSSKNGAGIDVSPALRDCLGMQGNEIVTWSFVAEGAVPEGPWKEIITTSPVRW